MSEIFFQRFKANHLWAAYYKLTSILHYTCPPSRIRIFQILSESFHAKRALFPEKCTKRAQNPCGRLDLWGPGRGLDAGKRAHICHMPWSLRQCSLAPPLRRKGVLTNGQPSDNSSESFGPFAKDSYVNPCVRLDLWGQARPPGCTCKHMYVCHMPWSLRLSYTSPRSAGTELALTEMGQSSRTILSESFGPFAKDSHVKSCAPLGL